MRTADCLEEAFQCDVIEASQSHHGRSIKKIRCLNSLYVTKAKVAQVNQQWDEIVAT